MIRIAFTTYAPWFGDEALTFDRDVAVIELDEAVLGHLAEADALARDVFRRDSQLSELRRWANHLPIEFYGLDLWEAVNPNDDRGYFFPLPDTLDLTAFEVQHVDTIETCIFPLRGEGERLATKISWEATFGDLARVWTDGIGIDELQSFPKKPAADS